MGSAILSPSPLGYDSQKLRSSDVAGPASSSSSSSVTLFFCLGGGSAYPTGAQRRITASVRNFNTTPNGFATPAARSWKQTCAPSLQLNPPSASPSSASAASRKPKHANT